MRKRFVKRGVTPIIATVLLIVLTLVGGGVVAYFTVPAVKNVDSSCLEAINQLSFEDVGYTCRLNSAHDPQNRGVLEGFSIRISDPGIIGFQVGFQDEGSADTYRVTTGAVSNAVCVLGSDFNQPLAIPVAGGVQTYIARGAHEKIYVAPILASGKSCFAEARKEVVVSNSCADPAVRNSMLGCYPEQGQPYCGDGNVDEENGEECDTNPVACTTATNYSGTRACNLCSLSSTCTTGAFCGNNVREGPEECDGEIFCSESCLIEEISGVMWDDSRVNHGEPAGLTVSGVNIEGQPIEVFIYEDDLVGDTLMTPTPLTGIYPLATSLHLSWNAVWECELEIFGLCVDQPEYIAVARLVNANSVSSQSGVLEVNSPPTLCGNGVVEGVETCDEGVANGQVCTPSYGGSCGYCGGSCQLITLQGASCGDGIRNGGESCDGGDLGGQSCTTIGQTFTQGTLSCSGSCMFDTSACSNSEDGETPISVCGNGVLEDGEACDDGNSDNGDACTNTCQMAMCGDGFIFAGTETCEPPGSVCTLSGGSGNLITGNAIGDGSGGSSSGGSTVIPGEEGESSGVCSSQCLCAAG